MANTKGSREPDRPTTQREARPLSGFEQRCLTRRICDCHAAVATLLRGVSERDDGVLGEVRAALEDAEAHIAKAERMVLSEPWRARA
jgi:hypothetical protein